MRKRKEGFCITEAKWILERWALLSRKGIHKNHMDFEQHLLKLATKNFWRFLVTIYKEEDIIKWFNKQLQRKYCELRILFLEYSDLISENRGIIWKISKGQMWIILVYNYGLREKRNTIIDPTRQIQDYWWSEFYETMGQNQWEGQPLNFSTYLNKEVKELYRQYWLLIIIG